MPESCPSPSGSTAQPLWRFFVVLAIIAFVFFMLGRMTAPSVVPSPVVPTPILGSAADDSGTLVGRSRSATLEEVLQMARRGLVELEQNVDDYTAKMVKQERIGDRLHPEQTIELKLQTRRIEGGEVTRPMRVYLHFLLPAESQGQEVIWVENENDGKLVAHKGGSWNLLRAWLKPDSFLAMSGNRYPITQIGMTNLIKKLIERGEHDLKTATATVTITDGHRVGDRECQLIRVRHAEPNGDPDDFSLAEIAIDSERLLPLRYTAFGWPSAEEGGDPPLLESYTYLDVRVNEGLTESDFDPDNPAYDFP